MRPKEGYFYHHPYQHFLDLSPHSTGSGLDRCEYYKAPFYLLLNVVVSHP